MSEYIVSLPMYDWPELQSHNDHFYDQLKASLKERGFETPEALERTRDRQEVWQSNQLLLSQTCGLPLVTSLENKVSLIGTPAYGVDCGAGSYYSVIVVHNDSTLEKLDDLKGKIFAYNEKGSQSGYAALLHTLSFIENAPEHFTRSVPSGAHRESIKFVADRRADFAAIDAVTWELALRHEPAAEKIRVITYSEPTPTLPFITAMRSPRELDMLHMAVVDAMVGLDEATREALLLIGFSPTQITDYQVIQDRLNIVRETFGSNY